MVPSSTNQHNSWKIKEPRWCTAPVKVRTWTWLKCCGECLRELCINRCPANLNEVKLHCKGKWAIEMWETDNVMKESYCCLRLFKVLNRGSVVSLSQTAQRAMKVVFFMYYWAVISDYVLSSCNIKVIHMLMNQSLTTLWISFCLRRTFTF